MPIIFEPVPEWLQDELAAPVEAALWRLHIPASMDGFHYLMDAIMQTVLDPQRTRFITKELYPELAKLYETTASCVERSMRTAVLHCWNYGGRETLDKIAGYHLTERPTNSEFIALIAAYIRRTG